MRSNVTDDAPNFRKRFGSDSYCFKGVLMIRSARRISSLEIVEPCGSAVERDPRIRGNVKRDRGRRRGARSLRVANRKYRNRVRAGIDRRYHAFDARERFNFFAACNDLGGKKRSRIIKRRSPITRLQIFEARGLSVTLDSGGFICFEDDGVIIPRTDGDGACCEIDGSDYASRAGGGIGPGLEDGTVGRKEQCRNKQSCK
jgi:hypothetical protein